MNQRLDKEAKKILIPDLPSHKKAMLLRLVLDPGWKVVEEIANEACLAFTQDIIKLDPEVEDYERKQQVRTLRARNAVEFSEQLFRSITEHARAVREADKPQQVREEKPGDAFGIYPAKKIDSNEAIKNVYGIHPARPNTNPSKEGKK